MEIRDNKNFQLAEFLLSQGVFNKNHPPYPQSPQYSWLFHLFADNHINSHTIALLLQQHFQLPIFDLSKTDLNQCPSQFVIPELIHQFFVCPVALRNNQLLLAMADPSNQQAIDHYQQSCQFPIKPLLVNGQQLMHYITQVLEQNEKSNHSSDVVTLVEKILLQAIHQRCSDIHFEPQAEELKVRLRKDGLLVVMQPLAKNLSAAVAARIKVLANLDIAEKRIPQDGRFQLNQGDHHFRVSTCPTTHGEKIVIRVLQNNPQQLQLSQLGLLADQQHLLEKILQQPQGLILVCGPTGSGKTATLYALLQYLNNEQRNIASVEDPVEMDLPHINQVNVQPKIGLTFAKVLRAFLRQDPDIMMVGEIRDEETAAMAIKAAQTGHLILATLHTNSATAAISRLRNMGIADYHIASALRLVISQRLFRRGCPHCHQQGCHQCHQGYNGRLAAFELLAINDEGAEIIANQKDINQLTALAPNWQTIQQVAQQHVQNNLTTAQEYHRVLGQEHSQ